MLKNNEKFMKDLKRKHEEERKVDIEAVPKAKEKLPQKPKAGMEEEQEN